MNMKDKIYTIENLRDETEAMIVDNNGKWNWLVVKLKKYRVSIKIPYIFTSSRTPSLDGVHLRSLGDTYPQSFFLYP